MSASFLASNYCYKVEMQRAIERHERKEARVIPIILRPVLWNEPPIDKLQALPDSDPMPERRVLIANLNQLIETVKLQMQPPPRAMATASTLQQLSIFIPNDVTLTDLVVGWRTLSQSSNQGEDPATSQRRVTCNELANLAAQFTIDQGNLAQAIMTWHIWVDAFKNSGDPRQAAMAKTFTRELAELQEALR